MLAALGAGWLLIAAPSWGAGLSVTRATFDAQDGHYVINADFDLKLSGALEDALSRGIVLYFVVEAHIWRPRWWWLDAKIAAAKLTRKLSFNSLTRQYRLSSDATYQNFASLSDAQDALSRVHNLPMMNANELSKNQFYRASVSMWLDVSQLPKPFQVKAVTSDDWNLVADDYVFDVAL
ncbi:MAG: DUF4390 domain-containing protein [Burkholderiales bacterium]